MRTRSMAKQVPATPEHLSPETPVRGTATVTPDCAKSTGTAFEPITPNSPDSETGDVQAKDEGTVVGDDPFVQQPTATVTSAAAPKLDSGVLVPVTQQIDQLSTTTAHSDEFSSPKRARDDAVTSIDNVNTKRQRLPLIEGLEAYTHVAHEDPKDRNFTELEVWSDRRQGICEALPWYKSYKGSLYTTNKVPRGMLLDGLDRPQDVLQAQVIITTIGGGRVDLKKRADSKSAVETSPEEEVEEDVIAQCQGSMTRATDHDENCTEVQSLQNGRGLGSYVGIIVGNQLRAFKDHPTRYSVLDFFQVTDVWCEKAAFKKFSDSPEGKICRQWCVRLEKVNLNTVSWWDTNPAHYAPLDQPYNNELCASIKCEECKQESKHIYNEGWTCLNHKCSKQFLNQQGKFIQKATYNQQFLAERTPLKLRPNEGSDTNPSSVFHEAPQPTAQSHGTEASSRGGVICEKCGCCSRLIYWARHECENPKCDWTRPIEVKVYPGEDLAKENEAFDARMAKAKTSTDKRFLAQGVEVNQFAVDLDIKIIHRVGSIGPYELAQFLLPSPTGKIIGSVSIFRASDDIRANGVDALFDDLSTQEIGLKRNVVSCKGSAMEGLSRNFSQNFGAFYKFGVTVQSKGFSEAPDVVLKSVQRLQWAQKEASELIKDWITGLNLETSLDFNVSEPINECLVLGYMQDDRIGFHDDGEKGVGQSIATLSLGSPALMSFRPKSKVSFSPEVLEGRTFSAAIVKALIKKKEHRIEGKVIQKKPLTADEQDLLDNYVDIDQLKKLEEANEGLNQLYRTALSFVLKHGDILVMQGDGIHRHYEHKVDPDGGRRFALTCRHIKEVHLTAAQRKDRLVKGEIPARAAAFAYDGDMHLAPAGSAA